VFVTFPVFVVTNPYVYTTVFVGAFVFWLTELILTATFLVFAATILVFIPIVSGPLVFAGTVVTIIERVAGAAPLPWTRGTKVVVVAAFLIIGGSLELDYRQHPIPGGQFRCLGSFLRVLSDAISGYYSATRQNSTALLALDLDTSSLSSRCALTATCWPVRNASDRHNLDATYHGEWTLRGAKVRAAATFWCN